MNWALRFGFFLSTRNFFHEFVLGLIVLVICVVVNTKQSVMTSLVGNWKLQPMLSISYLPS